jgi:hypothetical protein
MQGTDRCSFVVWVDEPWNPVLTRSLIHLWILVGVHSKEGIMSGESDYPMDQAYIALLAEKNNLQIALEHKETKMKTSEFKLKETIRRKQR